MTYGALLSCVLAVRLELSRWGLRLSADEVTAARQALYFHLAMAIVAGTLLVAVRRLRVNRPLAPRLVLATMPLIMLGSADRLLAMYFEPTRETDGLHIPHPTRGWTTRPGWSGRDYGVPVRTNRHGLRGPDVPLEKAPGERRILFLGDSVVFGWRTSSEDTLVMRVRQLAAGRGDASLVTAINCATQAYSPWQEFDLLVNDCIRLRPDLIIHVFCLNDVLEKFQLYEFGGYARGFEPPTPAPLEWSGLYRAIRAANGRMLRPSGDQVWRQRDRFSVRRMLHDADAEDVLRGWDITLENMAKIVSAAREHSIPIVIVCAPHLDQLAPNPPAGPAPQEVLAGFAKERDIPYLDLRAAFRTYIEASALEPATLFIDPLHFSPTGYSVAAEAVYRFLVEGGLLE
jgi:lysophospholipase L1-like esterase